MKTKKPSAQPQVSKLIATHALVAAFFTTPWVIFGYSDLFTIFIGGTNSADQQSLASSNLHLSLSVLSFAALMVAVVAFGYYLVKKSK